VKARITESKVTGRFFLHLATESAEETEALRRFKRQGPFVVQGETFDVELISVTFAPAAGEGPR
jgi:hypothetical protein